MYSNGMWNDFINTCICYMIPGDFKGTPGGLQRDFSDWGLQRDFREGTPKGLQGRGLQRDCRGGL